MKLPDEIEFDIVFEDLYFAGALQSRFQASDLLRRLGEREGGLRWLDLHHLLVAWDVGDDTDELDETGPATAVDQAEEAYHLLVQALAATHVFAAMTLEAHINRLAETRLSPRLREHFEGLRLPSKWLFLPQLLGAEPFDAGTEPFQSFHKLVSIRNAIVHLRKNGSKRLLPDAPDPLAAAAAGLSIASASISATRAIAVGLAAKLSHDPPGWADSDDAEFFHFAVLERIGTLSPQTAADLDEHLWRAMLTSEPVEALRDLGASITPAHVLRHDSFGRLARSFGARWFRDQAENWRLVSENDDRRFPPSCSSTVNLKTGEASPIRRVTSDRFAKSYADLRTEMVRVLAEHGVTEKEFLRVRRADR